jgi:hypothetical protein
MVVEGRFQVASPEHGIEVEVEVHRVPECGGIL